MKHSKIVFISNPVSGSTKKKPGATFLRSQFDSSYETVFLESKYSGHASELAAEAVKNNATTVVAIGGDGTVNEIARSLNGTACVLGIIPCGSGNGLARHHNISMNVPEAIAVIKKNNVVSHDAVSINGQLSFNVSGIGFDAHVAHLFGKDGKRGFNTYIKLVVKEFANYSEKEIRVTTNEGVIAQPIMLAAIANGSQFGNNARIAPHANTNDGMVDITLVRKMSAWKLPMFMYEVFNHKAARSSHAKLLKGENFVIDCETEIPLHIDGEPAGFSRKFMVSTLKSSLRLIVPLK